MNSFFSVENKFVSSGKVNVQGSIELINFQAAEINEIIKLESMRTWLNDDYLRAF